MPGSVNTRFGQAVGNGSNRAEGLIGWPWPARLGMLRVVRSPGPTGSLMKRQAKMVRDSNGLLRHSVLSPLPQQDLCFFH